MTKSAGHVLALLTLWLVGSDAMAQTRPWPTDAPQQQQQSAPWPDSTPPAQQPPQQAPWPGAPAQQSQQQAPWPGGAPQGQPAAMSAPPPTMGGGGPPGGPQGQMPPCVAEFMGLRDKVEKSAAVAKAASERKAGREEMCKHVTAYFDAEVRWINYAKANVTKCGIPAEVTKQIETVHVRTSNIRKQICSAGPGPAGPAAPTLSDALGTTTMPADTARSGRGTLDTLTGNALKR